MPIHYAAVYGASEALDFLLNNGADFDVPGNLKSVPLHFASDGGHINCVNALLRRGAQVDLADVNGDLNFYK